jgi:hypothetical protein
MNQLAGGQPAARYSRGTTTKKSRLGVTMAPLFFRR